MNFAFLVLIVRATRYGWVTAVRGNEKWGSAVGKKMTSKWSESIKGRADILQQKNWLWSFKSIAKYVFLFHGKKSDLTAGSKWEMRVCGWQKNDLKMERKHKRPGGYLITEKMVVKFQDNWYNTEAKARRYRVILLDIL